MSREPLVRAGELLRTASESADDENADRLNGFADQLETLASRDRGPDHGRLARILTSLSEIAEEADDETRTTVEEARTEITEFRKGVEGV